MRQNYSNFDWLAPTLSMDLAFLRTLEKDAITSTCIWRHNIIVEISKIQPLLESLGGSAVRAIGFPGANQTVVLGPNRFESQPCHFFFSPKVGTQRHFSLKFFKKKKKSSMEKKCADFRLENK